MAQVRVGADRVRGRVQLALSRRTLVLAQNLPLPVRQGYDFRVLQNVVGLTALGPVTVFGLRVDDDPPPPPPGVTWTTSRDGEPTRPRFGTEALAWMREPDGSPYDQFRSEIVTTEITDLIANLAPDIIVVEDFAFLPHLATIAASRAFTVFDFHNVLPDLFDQLAQSASTSQRAQATIWRRTRDRMQRDTEVALQAADAIWVTSPRDLDLLANSVKFDGRMHVVPNTVDVDAYDFVAAPRGGRTLVYPAMFRFPPNLRAAEFLATELLPELPGYSLELVGDQASAELRTLAENPAVSVVGRVDDVRPYLARASAMPVALFAGSGTRLKILEGWASGCPVVSTAKGAEGLDCEWGVHLLRAETATEFVDAIRALEHEPELAGALSRAGRALVTKRYSWAAAREAIRGALKQ